MFCTTRPLIIKLRDFCDDAAIVLPEAADDLRAAAKVYRREVALAEEQLAAFLSGDEAEWQSWLSDERNCREGAVTVARMMENERAAVSAIERALAAVGES